MGLLNLEAGHSTIPSMTLGEKIVHIAQLKGYELKQIAARAGIPYHTLRGYVALGKSPSVRTGIALAKALDVGIEWLFDDSQGPPPPRYHEPPPFDMTFWPPHNITWEGVDLAIKVYVKDQAIQAKKEWERRLLAEGPAGQPPTAPVPSLEPAARAARAAIILTARGEYEDLDEPSRKVTSERAWINETLREHGMARLGDDEARTLGIPEDEPVIGIEERKALIEEARKRYAELPKKDRKKCSEFAWVSDSLRMFSMESLKAREAKALGIKTE